LRCFLPTFYADKHQFRQFPLSGVAGIWDALITHSPGGLLFVLSLAL
jgi:hypothetical protein